MTKTFDPSENLSRFPTKHSANNCFNRSGFVHCVSKQLRPTAFIVKKCYDNRNGFYLSQVWFYQSRDPFVPLPIDNVEMLS